MIGQVKPIFKDATVWVIGGGPSLSGFDFSAFNPRFMIGANDSGRVLGAHTIVTIDHNYYRHREKQLLERAQEGYTVYAALPTHVKEVLSPIIRLNHLGGSGRGLSPHADTLTGLTSGHAALNVAFLAGATDIRLFGFDYKFGPEKKHWHPEYTWDRNSGRDQIHRWAREFDFAARQLADAGVKVTNYVGETGSSLTQFPTKRLEEVAA